MGKKVIVWLAGLAAIANGVEWKPEGLAMYQAGNLRFIDKPELRVFREITPPEGKAFFLVMGQVRAGAWQEGEKSLELEKPFLQVGDETIAAMGMFIKPGGFRFSGTIQLKAPHRPGQTEDVVPFVMAFVAPKEMTGASFGFDGKSEPVYLNPGNKVPGPADMMDVKVTGTRWHESLDFGKSNKVIDGKPVELGERWRPGHGRILGVTVEMTPKRSNFNDHGIFQYVSTDVGLLLPGENYLHCIASGDAEGGKLAQWGGGGLSNRNDDGSWGTVTSTFFFVAPADLKEFQFAWLLEPIAAGRVE